MNLALGKENLASCKATFSSRGLIFGGFFNPWDGEIAIPETWLIQKSSIPEWTTDCNRGVWIEEDRVSVGANSTYGCINWYGFGYYNQNQTEYDYYDGSISTTFSGNGHAELDFGNCYKTGIVYATLGVIQKLRLQLLSIFDHLPHTWPEQSLRSKSSK